MVIWHAANVELASVACQPCFSGQLTPRIRTPVPRSHRASSAPSSHHFTPLSGSLLTNRTEETDLALLLQTTWVKVKQGRCPRCSGERSLALETSGGAAHSVASSRIILQEISAAAGERFGVVAAHCGAFTATRSARHCALMRPIWSRNAACALPKQVCAACSGYV